MNRPLHILLAAAGLLASPAAAVPVAPPGTPDPQAVLRAGGCHSDIRRHLVPEFGRAVPHFHDGDCRPVRAGNTAASADCHRDAREHRVPGMGMVLHRHVGEDCRIRVIRRAKVPLPG